MVRKFFAISCLCVYLFSTTELSQLLKVPILIHHYFETKAKIPDLTFETFLIVHYNDHLKNHPRNKDYDTDTKLPFINHSELIGFSVVVPHPEFLYEVEEPDVSAFKKIIRNDSFSENKLISNIWQPPRTC